MDNVKNDKYYANKIMTDVQYLIGLTEEYSYEELQVNETVLDSIFFRFIQIAENATKLSKELKTRENKIDWGAISGLRNRIVHDYGHTDLGIILSTLKEDIPELKNVMEKYADIKQ
ncbi:MAG: DUF86 domain-containing protein [Clostridiales bacterium]|nr:DUF86 domain-containing protein [Clostridiales bacterium]